MVPAPPKPAPWARGCDFFCLRSYSLIGQELIVLSFSSAPDQSVASRCGRARASSSRAATPARRSAYSESALYSIWRLRYVIQESKFISSNCFFCTTPIAKKSSTRINDDDSTVIFSPSALAAGSMPEGTMHHWRQERRNVVLLLPRSPLQRCLDPLIHPTNTCSLQEETLLGSHSTHFSSQHCSLIFDKQQAMYKWRICRFFSNWCTGFVYSSTFSFMLDKI